MVGLLVILMLLGSLAFAGHRQVPLAVGCLALGFAVSALTDVGYTYLTVVHEYVSVRWLNVGWQTEAVLLCLAGLIAIRNREHAAAPVMLPRDSGLPLILAGLAITITVIAVGSSGGRISVTASLIGAYAVVAVVVRLWLTARENRDVASRFADALIEQERLAITDGLTGLHNRRFFEELLRMEVDRAVGGNQALGLPVLDVDHFKQVNDRLGHQAGDLVLRELAIRLVTSARTTNVLARYGGEEFVLILPGTDNQQIREIAERCRTVVCERPFHLPDGQRLQLTISIGGACLDLNAGEAEGLVRAADRALYAAKAEGRDASLSGASPGPPSNARSGARDARIGFAEDLLSRRPLGRTRPGPAGSRRT